MAPTGYLALDATLSSTGMIVVLLSKIRAGQLLNCPVFSSTIMKVFLSMLEKRKIVSEAFADASKFLPSLRLVC